MLRWTVGDVTITRVVEVELPIPYDPERPFITEATPAALSKIDWLRPHFVSEDGDMVLSVHALLVEGPGLRLVVDTCFGNDKPRALLGKRPLQSDFLEALAGAGFERETVDAVVCTHLHVDHVGWNTMLDESGLDESGLDESGDAPRWVPTFPNARYLMGRVEYEFWSQSDDKQQQPVMEDSVTPIVDAGLAELVEMDHRISREIRLVPTPGHTPGHVSVEIQSRGETALISGDIFHNPCQIARPAWGVPFDVDGVEARATRERTLEHLAESGDLVIGTHFPAPTAGRVVRDVEGYRFCC